MKKWMQVVALTLALLMGGAVETGRAQDLTTSLAKFLITLQQGFMVWPNKTSAPSTTQEGALYYDSTLHAFQFYNGTTFGSIGSAFSMGANTSGDVACGNGTTTALIPCSSGNITTSATQLSAGTMVTGGISGVRLNGGSSSVDMAAALLLKWYSNNWTDTNDTAIGRAAAGVVEISNGTPGTQRDLKLRMLRVGQAVAPTCTANCGTSPSVTGSDSAMIVVMGATGVPASPFTVTFNTTWATAPSCTATSGTAQTARYVTAAVTTTTTIAVTTAAAPSAADKFNILCVGVS